MPKYNKKIDEKARALTSVLDSLGATRAVKQAVTAARFDSRFTSDAAGTHFLATELEFVKSKVWEDKYRPLKAAEFIPVSQDADPGAETIVWREEEMHGLGKIISDYASDLPTADVGARRNTREILSVGSSFRYSIKDIMASMFSGRSLRDSQAKSARRAIERKIDEVAAIGHTASGITGFLNNASVGTASMPNGDWTTATGDEMLADLNQMTGEVFSESGEVETPDTLLLPIGEYQIASQKRLGDTQTTVLRHFIDTNEWIKEVKPWWRLDTAGAGSVARAVVYRKDPDVVSLEIPMLFEMFDVQMQGLSFLTPCLAMTAGCIVHRPLAMQYSDFDA